MSWSRVRRILGPLLAVVVGAVLVAAALGGEGGLPEFAATGEPRPLPATGEFPVVSLEDFEGIVVGQRGMPVVVNMWASWCAPCRTEMPLLQDAAEAYEGRATILGVATKDDPDEARRFLTELGVSYPNVFDITGDIRVTLGLNAYPTTYIFDADGELSARVTGGISEQRLAALIEDALR